MDTPFSAMSYVGDKAKVATDTVVETIHDVTEKASETLHDTSDKINAEAEKAAQGESASTLGKVVNDAGKVNPADTMFNQEGEVNTLALANAAADEQKSKAKEVDFVRKEDV
jgi:hypothetical protein